MPNSLRQLIGRLQWRVGIAWDRMADLGPVPECCRRQGNTNTTDARPSPLRSLSFEVAGERALLCYGAPSVRGRQVFGDLVPFGELWRMGANEPTRLYLPRACSVGGIPARKGRYSLYAVPAPGGLPWTLVLNRSIHQWGLTRPERGPKGNLFPSAYTDRVRAREVGRTTVPSAEAEFTEVLRIDAVPDVAGTPTLLLRWERTEVRIPVSAKKTGGAAG